MSGVSGEARAMGWRVLSGTGLVFTAHDRACVVDLASLRAPEDLVDILNAFDAPDPIDAMSFPMARLPELRCGVARRESEHTLVAASAGVELVTDVGVLAGADIPDGPIEGAFSLRLGGTVGGDLGRPDGPVVAGGGFSLGVRMLEKPVDAAGRPWWETAGETPGRDEPTGPAEVPRRPRPAEAPDPVLVDGIVCANGHLNNPVSLTCMFDGLSLITATTRLVRGPRPAFASFVLEGGRSVPLRRDSVMGRDPQTESGVAAGTHDPIALVDGSGAMSRAHARISLDGWQVQLRDAGSRHGTYLRHLEATEWEQVTGATGVVLRAGDLIRLGGCSVRFERHDGA